jgi:hypothetical protein
MPQYICILSVYQLVNVNDINHTKKMEGWQQFAKNTIIFRNIFANCLLFLTLIWNRSDQVDELLKLVQPNWYLVVKYFINF